MKCRLWNKWTRRRCIWNRRSRKYWY